MDKPPLAEGPPAFIREEMPISTVPSNDHESQKGDDDQFTLNPPSSSRTTRSASPLRTVIPLYEDEGAVDDFEARLPQMPLRAFSLTDDPPGVRLSFDNAVTIAQVRAMFLAPDRRNIQAIDEPRRGQGIVRVRFSSAAAAQAALNHRLEGAARKDFWEDSQHQLLEVICTQVDRLADRMAALERRLVQAVKKMEHMVRKSEPALVPAIVPEPRPNACHAASEPVRERGEHVPTTHPIAQHSSKGGKRQIVRSRVRHTHEDTPSAQNLDEFGTSRRHLSNPTGAASQPSLVTPPDTPTAAVFGACSTGSGGFDATRPFASDCWLGRGSPTPPTLHRAPDARQAPAPRDHSETARPPRSRKRARPASHGFRPYRGANAYPDDGIDDDDDHSEWYGDGYPAQPLKTVFSCRPRTKASRVSSPSICINVETANRRKREAEGDELTRGPNQIDILARDQSTAELSSLYDLEP